MRLIPLITAITVTLGLYFFVIERDSLLAFARGETDDETAQPAENSTQDTAQNADESAGRIGVVVLQSMARPLDSAVVLRGQTQAMRQVEVRAETTSTVISPPLRKGAHVKTGDILCELDPGTRPAALLEARARLLEAQARLPEADARLVEAEARLAEAEINLIAAIKLSEGGFASETRLAGARAAERAAMAGIASAKGGLETSKAGVESARAAVAAAEKELQRLTITAPFDGLLESDTAEIGSLLQPGGLCATVIQLDQVKLVGFVPEGDVGRVIMGSPAGARLADGSEVAGLVTFVSRSADETTRTFEVEITVDNADLRIRDGQTADIAITAEGKQAHLLPQSALTLNNEGLLGVRTVDETNTVGFAALELLRDSASGVWVSGLPDTADVIIVGQEFVSEGVRVAPTYREAAQ